MMTLKLTISPSSYAPIVGETVDAVYANSCLRYQSIKHLFKVFYWEAPFPALFGAIGTLAEEYVATDPALAQYQREVPFEFDMQDGVIVRGRADFLGDTEVVEVKGSISSNVRTMWRRGEVSERHLGQLKSYMLFMDRPTGVLRMYYAHFLRGRADLSLEAFEYRVPELTKADEVALKAFYTRSKEAILSDDLMPAPCNDTPCWKCPFVNICMKGVKSKQEFTEKVVQILEAGPAQGEPSHTPRIKVHNRV